MLLFLCLTHDRRYLFETLDGSGFRAELLVDEDGIVLDYCKLQLSNPHVYSVKSGMASVLLNAGFGV